MFPQRLHALELRRAIRIFVVREFDEIFVPLRATFEDETLKRALYERAGVSEYWVVDPELDIVRVYRREGEHFARPIELSAEAGDVLTTTLLPGLVLQLADIFRM